MARGEVVGAVEHDVGRAHQRREALGPGALFQRLDADVGIDALQCRRRGAGLGLADGFLAMHHLALQVGEVDLVAVADGDAAHAAGGEVHQRRRAQAARADDQRMRVEEALLRLLAELVQQ
jgi:hypothetical protein